MSKLLTLHDPATAKVHYESGAWQRDTMYSLLAGHAAVRGGAFAVRDSRRRITYQQLLREVDSVALALHRTGLRPGERVSVWLPSRIEAVIVFLACSRNGYVCNPSLHQNYTADEVCELLRRTSCRVLVTQYGYGASENTAATMARLLQVESLMQLYCVGTWDTGTPEEKRVQPFPASGDFLPDGAGVDMPEPSSNPDKVVYLAFTSGTTGTPKGVMHSDNTLLANARVLIADWKHPASTVLLSLSPLSHHIGTVALTQCLAGGFELVTHEPLGGVSQLDWIETCGATYVMGVPTHAMDIQSALTARGQQQLGKVRTFYMAGSPIPRATARHFLDMGITPQNVYGMTENGSHQYTLPDDSPDTIVATCGRACAAYEVMLWDPENPDVQAAPGEIGEIGGRGGVLMLGYFADQTASQNSFNSTGWFMSGDLGTFDGNGNLSIVGRKKDLIIRGGHNIHPARIEDLAHRHPKVQKAAAFGVADERLGEKVCLAIIASAGTTPAPGEILQHLHDAGLSKYDMPEFFIAVPSFPLTPSGKVLKRELVSWVKNGRMVPLPVRWTAGKG